MKRFIYALAGVAYLLASCAQNPKTDDFCDNTVSNAVTRSLEPVGAQFNNPVMYTLNCQVDSLAATYITDSQQRSIWSVFGRIFCIVSSDAFGALICGANPFASIFGGIACSAFATEITVGMTSNNMQSGGLLTYVNDSSVVFSGLVLDSLNLTLSDSTGYYHNTSLYQMYKSGGERPEGRNVSDFMRDCLDIAEGISGLDSNTIDFDSLVECGVWLDRLLRTQPTPDEMVESVADQFPELEDEALIIKTIVQNCLSIQMSSRRQYIKQCIVAMEVQIEDETVRQRLYKSMQTVYASSMLWNIQQNNLVSM